jgi:hypothetical protein
LEDVVVLADSAGVALGVQRTFSARVRSVRDNGSRLIASKCVEIPLVGRDGEISGVLCRAAPRSDTRGVLSSCGPERVRAIADVAQFVVHDINNLFAVIGGGLRLLECQSDAAYRKAIVGKMQRAITRGALLSRQFLDAAQPRPKSIDEFVAGSRLAAMAGTLDRALRLDITVRTEIAPKGRTASLSGSPAQLLGISFNNFWHGVGHHPWCLKIRNPTTEQDKWHLIQAVHAGAC